MGLGASGIALAGCSFFLSRIGQYTREYLENITPPFTRALFNYVQEGKYTFCTPGHMGGSAIRKARWAACSMIFLAGIR